MRTFLLAWVVAFGLVAVVATGIGSAVGRTPPPTPAPRSPRFVDGDTVSSGPFTEADAVDVVSKRFGTNVNSERLRQELRSSAKVTYHSVAHWRVCVDAACWVAHGPGRYAEPENDAAWMQEAHATTTQ